MTEQQLYKFLAMLMSFPYSKISANYVASHILSNMEDNGITISEELVKCIVDCRNEEALKIIMASII